jgi:lactose/L-arabinose transport system substrate-binding protein
MKTWKWLILLVGTLLTMSACSGTESRGEGEITEVDKITAWAWDPRFNIAALDMAEDYFAGETELETIENAQDDIIQKLNTGLSSGTMKGMPNIVLIEDYRAQSFLQAYPDAFYPLDDYINPDEFASYKVATTSLDGKQYGVPFDSGVTGLYVRTDYLEEAGYTVDDVTNITWEEYVEIGKAVKEKTGVDMITIDPNDLGIVRVMIQTVGSWYVEEDGTTPDIANNEGLAKAFELYKQMMEENIVKINSDWSQFVAAFNNGEVATVPTGNWITASVKAEESQAGDWAVVPIPRLDMEGAVNASNLGGSSWYVLNVDGKEQAAEFLAETFGANTDFYKQLVKEIGAIGTYLPALEEDDFSSEDEYFGGQNIIQAFSKWTDDIKGVNYGMHTYSIEDILVAAMQDYLNGKELEAVLSQAQSQAEAQLK